MFLGINFRKAFFQIMRWPWRNGVMLKGIDMKKSYCVIISIILISNIYIVSSAYANERNSDSPYSISFDLRDMTGFDDSVINADDVGAFIREKAPDSPMLDEMNVGELFIDAGIRNEVNPAFLIAVAYLESSFGTAGWAKLHQESYNALGYAIYLGNESPNDKNSAGSWCKMVSRVASVIANGDSYYKQDLFTVAQVSAKYPGNPNPAIEADLMNELYSFSVNRKSSYVAPSEPQSVSKKTSQSTEKEPVVLSGYKPTYIPKVDYTPPEPIQIDKFNNQISVQSNSELNIQAKGAQVNVRFGIVGDSNEPLSGAQFTGHDGAGNNIQGVADSNGYITVKGSPGNWGFTAYASGYFSNTWNRLFTDSNYMILRLQKLGKQQALDITRSRNEFTPTKKIIIDTCELNKTVQ